MLQMYNFMSDLILETRINSIMVGKMAAIRGASRENAYPGGACLRGILLRELRLEANLA